MENCEIAELICACLLQKKTQEETVETLSTTHSISKTLLNAVYAQMSQENTDLFNLHTQMLGKKQELIALEGSMTVAVCSFLSKNAARDRLRKDTLPAGEKVPAECSAAAQEELHSLQESTPSKSKSSWFKVSTKEHGMSQELVPIPDKEGVQNPHRGAKRIRFDTVAPNFTPSKPLPPGKHLLIANTDEPEGELPLLQQLEIEPEEAHTEDGGNDDPSLNLQL